MSSRKISSGPEVFIRLMVVSKMWAAVVLAVSNMGGYAAVLE